MKEKKILIDVIYQIHNHYSFFDNTTSWSSPFVFFAASEEDSTNTVSSKFYKSLNDRKTLKEDISDIICILGDWNNVADGIIFTSKAIYVDSPKNRGKAYRVRYDDIEKLGYDSDKDIVRILDYDYREFYITNKLWNKSAIYLFLEFSSKSCNYSKSEKREMENLQLPHFQNMKLGELIPGLIFGNVSNASTNYGEDKFNTIRGHGFAAERANHLFDTLSGHQAQIVGDDNAKNGADRLVDGIQIQSKYCKTGSKCIAECFEDKQFRYYASDGSPIQIEVPSDKYIDAIKAMQDRIRRGEVKGVTDPQEAKNIIRKGHFTYTQVRNIAKAGTIESITYDAVNGAIVAVSVFGISSVISFATSLWNGEGIDIALKNAAYSGLKVGGITFVTSVLTGQLSKAGLNSLLVGSSESIIKILGPKGSAFLINSLRSGKNIYGAAAMKSAAKLLRSNVITGAISIVLFSTIDIIDLFRSRISGPQLFKNVTNTASSIAGGTAGWVGGAAAGAALGSAIPIVGNVAGGVIGGLVGAFGGGSVAGKTSNSILSKFIEDDAEAIVRAIEKIFIELATDYLLTQREVEHVIDKLSELLNAKEIKNIHCSVNMNSCITELIMPLVERELQRREKIHELELNTMQYGLRLLLEDMSDAEEIETVGSQELNQRSS